MTLWARVETSLRSELKALCHDIRAIFRKLVSIRLFLASFLRERKYLFLLILQHRQAGSWALTYCHVTNMCMHYNYLCSGKLVNGPRRGVDLLSRDQCVLSILCCSGSWSRKGNLQMNFVSIVTRWAKTTTPGLHTGFFSGGGKSRGWLTLYVFVYATLPRVY
jgi:hypothetical protein